VFVTVVVPELLLTALSAASPLSGHPEILKVSVVPLALALPVKGATVVSTPERVKYWI
jgi:hypothetical protein